MKKPNEASDIKKIISVIKSCKTSTHFDCAEKMIELYSKKWVGHAITHNLFMSRGFLLGFLLGKKDSMKL